MQLLESTIYLEVVKHFEHCQLRPSGNFFSDRKKSILAKMSLTINPKEKAGLEDLIAPIKKILNLFAVLKNIAKILVHVSLLVIKPATSQNHSQPAQTTQNDP